MALATAVGSAAYIALFEMIGVLARRAAVWSLAVVFLGERLLGGVLSGIAQLSPLWLAQPGLRRLRRGRGRAPDAARRGAPRAPAPSCGW